MNAPVELAVPASAPVQLDADPIVQRSAFVLIDFDNFMYERRQADDLAWLETELSQVIAEALAVTVDLEFVSIRLYGGWMSTSSFSPRANAVQVVLGKSNPFPKVNPERKGLVRGGIELATSLWEIPSIQWPETYRTTEGLPRLRLAKNFSEICQQPTESCPARVLAKFAKKKGRQCPVLDCQVTNDAAYAVVEQKMADTLLVADLISLSEQENVQALLVLSDDTDVLPGVALAAKRKANVVLYRMSSVSTYSAMLSNLGVVVREWVGK